MHANGAAPRVAWEFIRFSGVGVVSFGIDFGLFSLLLALGVQHILASSVSFCISVVVNYILTRRFVFASGPNVNVAKEFTYYVLLNFVALGLNTLVLFVCVDLSDLHPLLGKIIATAVVMVFNFVTRKMLIEHMSRNATNASPAD